MRFFQWSAWGAIATASVLFVGCVSESMDTLLDSAAKAGATSVPIQAGGGTPIGGPISEGGAEVAGGTRPNSGTSNGNDNGTTNGNDNGTTNGNDNGTTNGNDNGTTNGNDNGTTNGNDNGTTNGNDNGTTNGNDNGTTNGNDNGTTNGNDNGTTNGNDNGTTNGNDNGTTNGNDNGTTNGNDNGTTNGNDNGANGNDNGANGNDNGANGNDNGTTNGNDNGANGNDNGAGGTCPDGSTQLDTALVGGGADGDAEYRSLPAGCKRFRVNVDDLQPNKTYSVLINGLSVGTLRTDSGGKGELRYDTEDGNFPSNFPEVQPGDVVSVGTLSGTLQTHCSAANCNS